MTSNDSTWIQVPQTEGSSQFQPLEQQFILAVLEELLVKLSLLQARLPRVAARFDMRYLRERGAEPYLQPYKPLVWRGIHLWEWKLAWELDQLHRLLLATRNELRTQGKCPSLECYNQHHRDLDLEVKQYEEILRQSAGKKNGATLSTLQASAARESEQLSLRISTLQDKYLHSQIRASMIKEYMKNYEWNKIQQNKIKIELIESDLNKKIEKLLVEKGDEELAHNLIMQYFRESIEMLTDKVKYWQEELLKDTALWDSEYKKLESDMEEQSQKTMSLIIDYGKRERELENYLRERELREEERRAEEERERCAVKIQAWWRGCMVRWGLGSFSPDNIARKRRKRPKKK